MAKMFVRVNVDIEDSISPNLRVDLFERADNDASQNTTLSIPASQFAPATIAQAITFIKTQAVADYAVLNPGHTCTAADVWLFGAPQ